MGWESSNNILWAFPQHLPLIQLGHTHLLLPSYFTPECKGKAYLLLGFPPAERCRVIWMTPDLSLLFSKSIYTLSPLQHTLTCPVLSSIHSCWFDYFEMFSVALFHHKWISYQKNTNQIFQTQSDEFSRCSLYWSVIGVAAFNSIHTMYTELHWSYALSRLPAYMHACLTECMSEHPGWRDWIPGDLRVLYMEKNAWSPR